MKINEYPQEVQDKCNFACLVCLKKINSEIIGGKKQKACSCIAVLNEYCPYLEKAIDEEFGNGSK